MEERYLFKAKREDNKEWIFGSYAYAFVPDEKSHIYGLTRENHVIVEQNGNIVLIDKDTLCQCTGLKDKNGNLIWENDIIERTDIRNVNEPSIGKIFYDKPNTAFTIRWIDRVNYSPTYPWKTKIRIIGNEFDNPELLENEV